MASKMVRKGRKNHFIRRRLAENKDDHHVAKVEGKGHGMTLLRKLMLTAQLLGMEATVTFQQVYTVPILQTLGMPLNLAYLPGAVSGPSSLLILPLVGWLVDRGNNPRRRKFVAIIMAAAFLIGGMVCLLMANFIHLQYLLDYNGAHAKDESIINNSAAYLTTVSEGLFTTSVPTLSDTPPDSSVRTFYMNWSGLDPKLYSYSFTSIDSRITTANSPFDVNDAGSYVPFKAGLGLLGLIIMDLGFDASNCFVRAFLVTCSAREEHTSLFVMGTIMGAVGGVYTSVLGVVDFTWLLGLSSIDGGRLTIQTCAQGLGIILIVALGLFATLTTGRKQSLQLHESRNGSVSTKHYESSTSSTKHANGYSASIPEHVRRNSLADTFEASVRSFGGSSRYMDPPLGIVKESPPFPAEAVPLLKDETPDEEGSYDEEIQGSDNYGAVKPVLGSPQETQSEKTSVEEAGQSTAESDNHGCFSCIQNPKVRLLFVCITTFFATGNVALFVYSVSDFVAKAVYEGDPSAAPGSDSLIRYQEGVKTASWALLVYYSTYLVSGIVHSKILALLGFRVEYLLLQLLMIINLVIVALTSSLEALFVLTVVAAMHRTCFYTMPYAITNDIAQTIVNSDGRSQVGLAMSLVSACLPLAYCLLFTWAGVVEDLTGIVATPLWLGSGFGFLACISFLFLGKV